MGVPSYFYWLFSRFGDEILMKADQNINIDYLYLDLNCAIHPAVKAEGVQRDEMYSKVSTYLHKIITISKPSKLIYIAIDGVAPFAKMQQQRQRRFKNVHDKIVINQIKRKYKMPIEHKDIDFNMISPGTKFMYELSDHLRREIKKWKLHDPNWQNKEIILSDASVPGEGEHKIMDHIRQNNPNNLAIYGLDSDLIFLSLINYRKNMYLLREKIHFGKQVKNRETEFVYMSIEILREKLIYVLNPYTNITVLQDENILRKNKNLDNIIFKDLQYLKECHEMTQSRFCTTDEEINNLILDYIFICFMLGNDFLPSLPSLKIRDGGLDILLKLYKKILIQKKNFLVNKTKIDINFFIELLSVLSNIEDLTLKSHSKSRYFRIKNFFTNRSYRESTDYERDVLEYEYIENKYVDTIKFGEKEWEERYYADVFNIENRNIHEFQQNIFNICSNYLAGMVWTLHYYQSGCIDWKWSYLYPNSPSVTDLRDYILKNNINNITFTQNPPTTPFVQLLSILPPESSQLLPKSLAYFMTNNKSPIIYLYPTNFDIDMYGRRYRWECHPLLPKINLETLSNLVEKIKFTESELELCKINEDTPL